MLLAALLGVQTFFCLTYLYPLFVDLYGDTGFNLFLILVGTGLCISFWVTFGLLLCMNPGKLYQEVNQSYTVSALFLN